MKKAVVCVSFGTSVPAGRENITAVENVLRQAAQDRMFISAFTSPTIRRILRERGETVYSPAEALEALRKAGYKLYLLSNAQAAYTAQELCLLELTPCFDAIYLSSDYACRKPDPHFFKALLDGQHLDPDTCLMIGNDATTDIAGAQALGIDTLYLHTDLSPACEGNPATWRLEETDWNRILPELLFICK